MKLKSYYYQNTDVVALARDLIGKLLYTNIQGVVTCGRIVETEAYAGVIDKASHAYGGRFTPRTQTMYQSGGVGYVYLCYGIHNMFNIVTGPEGMPNAILVRGVEPVHGIGHMLTRRNQTKLKRSTAGGPGLVCQALGIRMEHNAVTLTGDVIWLEDDGRANPGSIVAGSRVGINYAGEDVNQPWRFRLKESLYTSPAK
ncbi:MAG: DNA-3-methyladenine glycosylase [Balneolales bacterium]